MAFKDIRVEPLNGMLDTRSPSGTLDLSTFRLLLNVDGSEGPSMCRMPGFRKYLGRESCYLNQDLHDQLVGGQNYYVPETDTIPGYLTQIGTSFKNWGTDPSYSDPSNLLPIYDWTAEDVTERCSYQEYLIGWSCREAITLLHSFRNSDKQRRLIAGTKTRLYIADERGGNWRILADGLGGSCMSAQDCACSTRRFKAATIGDFVLFGNGMDPVMFWQFDDGPAGCYHWSADYIEELILLEIDSAEIVQAWAGFSFIAGVKVAGEYIPGRLYWSDYNNPISWVPGGESLAGYHDFGAGERILCVEPIGGRLRVYTSRAVYDLTQSTDTALVFNIQEIYRGDRGLPVYRFSMVNAGDRHFYFGEDTIYVMAEYDREPTKFEWLHRASGVAFQGLPADWVTGFEDKLAPFSSLALAKCDLVTGGFEPVKKQVWFSWPTGNAACPNMSLVLWPAYNKATLYDHGFTAFVAHQPALAPTLRDYLASTGLCNPAGTLTWKEGKPCDGTFIDRSFPYLRNADEDPDAPIGPDGWLASICPTCFEELCESCDTDIRFVMASSTDKSLKELDREFYAREIITSYGDPVAFPDASTATYTQQGYTTLFQWDAYLFKTESDKEGRAIAFNFTADDQLVPGQMMAEMGAGAQPGCLKWEVTDLPVEIGACMDPALDGDDAEDTRMAGTPSWPFYVRGVYLASRVWTTGTGNQFCAASAMFKVRGVDNCW